MAYLLLFLGTTVYCLCREKGCGVQWTLLVLFAAQLMLRTMAQMMALLPAAVLFLATSWLLKHRLNLE